LIICFASIIEGARTSLSASLKRLGSLPRNARVVGLRVHDAQDQWRFDQVLVHRLLACLFTCLLRCTRTEPPSSLFPQAMTHAGFVQRPPSRVVVAGLVEMREHWNKRGQVLDVGLGQGNVGWIMKLIKAVPTGELGCLSLLCLPHSRPILEFLSECLE